MSTFDFTSQHFQTFGAFLKAHPDIERAVKNLMMDRMFDGSHYKKLIATKTNPFHINTQASLRIADAKFFNVNTSYGAMVYTVCSPERDYALDDVKDRSIIVMLDDMCYSLVKNENRFVFESQPNSVFMTHRHNDDVVVIDKNTGLTIPHTSHAWIFFT